MRKLNLTVPFVEAITQMSAYAKCLKEIMSKDKRFKDIKMVILNNLPLKLKDSGSFKNALCDLQVSVCLMPRSIFERLGIGDLKQINISLQMTDKFDRLSIGILEGIPIQVEKFFIPIDFIVCDMKKDSYIPIILGRPFLITAGAKIDVKCENFL
jgi:hypothetical protein